MTVVEQAVTLNVTLRIEGDKVKARGPRAAVERLLPAIREHKLELLSALSDASSHWVIVQSTARIERFFAPPISRIELTVRYPAALLIGLPDAVSDKPRPATDREAQEIRDLVEHLARLEGFTQDEEAEALQNAFKDAEAALSCLRALVKLAQNSQ